MSTNIGNMNANQSISAFKISNDDSISETDFIRLLQDEDQKEIEIAAQALHELLNLREKKIHEKSLKLIAGRVVRERNKDGSYDISPIGSFSEENSGKLSIASGIWSSINCVSIFQNLQIGDEVIILTNSSGGKVNSMIIGVYQQKSKAKFQELIKVVGNLVEDNKKLMDLISSFNEQKKIFEDYKKETNDKIVKMEENIASLQKTVASLQSFL